MICKEVLLGVNMLLFLMVTKTNSSPISVGKILNRNKRSPQHTPPVRFQYMNNAERNQNEFGQLYRIDINTVKPTGRNSHENFVHVLKKIVEAISKVLKVEPLKNNHENSKQISTVTNNLFNKAFFQIPFRQPQGPNNMNIPPIINIKNEANVEVNKRRGRAMHELIYFPSAPLSYPVEKPVGKPVWKPVGRKPVGSRLETKRLAFSHINPGLSPRSAEFMKSIFELLGLGGSNYETKLNPFGRI